MNKFDAISLDSNMLYERLMKAEAGALVPYRELSDLVGRDVQADGRGLLRTARRKALRDDRAVFGVVWDVGLKRLNDLEIVATGHDTIGRIRRLSRRSLQVITAVGNFDALPNESKVRHNAYASVLGMVAYAARSASVKRIEAAVEKTQERLPLARPLEAFGANNSV